MFCSECSDFRLLTRDPKDPSVVVSVRACRPCFDKFRGRKIRGQKQAAGTTAAPATADMQRNSRAEQSPPLHPHPTRREVEMPPQHMFEGEDADITGHETIRHEEDEDHYEYSDGHPSAVTLGVSSDVNHEVDRDEVMAAQGSVVLPSKVADGGLQFVDVAPSANRQPTAAVQSGASQLSDKDAMVTGGEKDEFERGSAGAVEGSEEILNIPSDALASVKHASTANSQPRHASTAEGSDGILSIPSDALASVKHAHAPATTASTADSVEPDGGIQYFRSDPCQVVMMHQPGSTAQQDEVGHTNAAASFPRGVSAVDGSEEILNIPSDALASVKHSNLGASQQTSRIDDGEVDWSERNVESHIVAQTPTAAVSMMFNQQATGDEQQQQQKPLNIVV